VMPYTKDSIWYSKNFHGYKILDNGPLRSTFQLIYDPWNVDGKPVSVVKTISTDAGSQMDKFEADYEYTGKDTMSLAVGIIKRNEQGEEFFNEKNNLMAYWEPQMGANGTTGVASIILQRVEKMMMSKDHLLAISRTKNKTINYYTGACWDKAGEITDSAHWFQYVSNFYEQLQHPLQINMR
jgi:hypothetical protein